jgi:hypothetical protein
MSASAGGYSCSTQKCFVSWPPPPLNHLNGDYSPKKKKKKEEEEKGEGRNTPIIIGHASLKT